MNLANGKSSKNKTKIIAKLSKVVNVLSLNDYRMKTFAGFEILQIHL